MMIDYDDDDDKDDTIQRGIMYLIQLHCMLPSLQDEIPLERPNTLGVLMCPARRRTVIER